MLGGKKYHTSSLRPVPIGTYAPMPTIKPKLSASRIKGLQSCSWEFYCSSCLKLPERVWSKTFVGSLVHIILECLAKDNAIRKKYVEQILAAKTHTVVPSIVRLVSIFKKKFPLMEEKHSVELDNLLMVGLEYDFYFSGAEKVLPPEFRFELQIGGAKIKGFVDRVAFYNGYAVIRDYKSQAKLFTESELENNIQAAIYQLAVKKVFGLPARVEFIMLRFPANSRSPSKHLQIVEPYSDSQLEGLVSYLEQLDIEFNNFTFEKAKENLRAHDSKKIGFCFNVCGYRQPFKYYAISKNGVLLRTSKTEIIPLENEVLSEHFYHGCPYFYSVDGKARNYS